MKKVHIIGGGTFSFVRSHFALAAPAYGTTGRRLEQLCKEYSDKLDVVLHLTRMAGGSKTLETVEDVAILLDKLKNDSDTKVIILNAAICDFRGSVGDFADSKTAARLDSKKDQTLDLRPYGKLISKIRDGRKDIFLVGFKQTCGLTEQEQYIAGLNLLKKSSCNLVLANDVLSRLNMIITPEEAKYHVTTNREEVLKNLVDMTYLRSHLTFVRSTVVAGDSVSWDSPLVPESLRKVVNHCIEQGAYKPFNGATVGHFACKVNDNTFLTSKRKTNFNQLDEIGLVKIETNGPDTIIAYGSKPSVGGQSQRIVFNEHKDYDCIVHFHSPIKEGSQVPVVSQREYECGSLQCGSNTSSGLKRFGKLSAVYLENHGPNIVFDRSVDPQEVIDFINDNFDLSEKTSGPVSLGQILETPSVLDDLRLYAKN